MVFGLGNFCLFFFFVLPLTCWKYCCFHINSRIGSLFGEGDIAQCVAEKIGATYGSSTFGMLRPFMIFFAPKGPGLKKLFSLSLCCWSLRTGGYSGEERLHARVRRTSDLSLDATISMLQVPVVTGWDDDGKETAELVDFPIVLPRDMVVALINAGFEDLLMGTFSERETYWKHMLKDYPEMTNYVQALDHAPLALYGDECSAFRQQVMMYHFQAPMNKHNTNSFLSRYCIAAVPAEKYWIAAWCVSFLLEGIYIYIHLHIQCIYKYIYIYIYKCIYNIYTYFFHFLHFFAVPSAGKWSEPNPSSNPWLCHGFSQPPFQRRSHNFKYHWQSCGGHCCCHWAFDFAMFFLKAVLAQNGFAVLLLFFFQGRKIYFHVMHVRGDWKWMKQSFNMVRHAQAQSICYHCLATKGSHVPELNYSDLSDGAIWKGTVLNCNHPWREEPALASLQWFSIKKVSMDLLHVWHLGVARDLCLDEFGTCFFVFGPVKLPSTRVFSSRFFKAPSRVWCCRSEDWWLHVQAD